MGICYDESVYDKVGNGSFNVSMIDPNAALRKHVENEYYLNFILLNSKDFSEKAQANKELGIANKKIDFWRKHPAYSQELEQEHRFKMKKMWKVVREA